MPILNCKCKNDYQDKKYGKGKRVHNKCDGGMNVQYKCTVCGNKRGA